MTFQNPSQKSLVWNPPPNLNKELEIYLKCVESSLLTNLLNKSYNISMSEKRAINSQKNDTRSIIIKSADKGSAVVVMGTNKYIDEAMRQLNNMAQYEEVSDNQLNKINLEINNFIELLHRHKHNKSTREALITWNHAYCAYISCPPKSIKPMFQEELSQQHRALRPG